MTLWREMSASELSVLSVEMVELDMLTSCRLLNLSFLKYKINKTGYDQTWASISSNDHYLKSTHDLPFVILSFEGKLISQSLSMFCALSRVPSHPF